MNGTRLVTLALAAVLGITCKEAADLGAPAGAHSLAVALNTPHGDDGAVLITVRGPDMVTVAAASPSYLVFSNLGTPGYARVIAIGDLRPGPLFTIAVSGAYDLTDYSVSLEQVATRSDALRSSLAGYSVTISRPGTP